jgi:GNAT superfamily N-acetyltransferase
MRNTIHDQSERYICLLSPHPIAADLVHYLDQSAASMGGFFVPIYRGPNLGKPMHVSLAAPDHMPDILTMIRALSAFHGDDATISPHQAYDAFFGPHPQATALIAKDGDAIVGYAGLTSALTLHTGFPRIDVHHLFVVEEWRAKGVGKALIAKARDIAIERKAQGLTIGTDPNNKVSQAAYRGMGLKEFNGTGPRFWIELGD